MSALDTLDSLQKNTGHSGKQQMRALPAKVDRTASNESVSLAILSRSRRQTQGVVSKLDTIADARDLIGGAEGRLNRMQNLLVRMRSQTEQATDNKIDPAERNAIQEDLSRSIHEIEEIIGEAPWDEMKLLDGLSGATDHSISVPTGVKENETIHLPSQKAELSDNVSLQANLDSNPKASNDQTDDPAFENNAGEKNYFTTVRYVRGADLNVSVNSSAKAKESTMKVDALIGAVTDRLRVLDAVKSQLAFKEGTLILGQTNSELHYYRIMDGDMARAQLGATKLQIFQQTPIAIATQANQAPEEILSFFY